jgi:hypothetical protein
MSTVKAKNIKVPNSAGTLEATLSFDGVDIVSDKPIAAPAAVSGNDLVNFSQVIGVGQTWQNVKASRAANVTYTNTTGKPIMVVISETGDNGGAMLTVNGVIVCYATTNNNDVPMSAIVPNNGTYIFNDAFMHWVELR